jgi:hypothetical protein
MNNRSFIASLRTLFLAGVITIAGGAALNAQTANDTAWLDVYGFAMLDMGTSGIQSHPDWFDVLRPTKMPSFKDEFGKGSNFFASVRQTRFGVKAGIPTEMGELKTTFEFELFGTGVDAGQTTFRLRHAYAELGQFGAGQTWSPFMDPDVFPNSIEYWGPSGMVFFRNVQIRWTPIQEGDSRLVLALERPGASADQGNYADRIALQNIKPRFQYPDLSGHYKYGQQWGYVQLAGIVREMKWDDLNGDAVDLSGTGTGWGLNLSSNLKVTPNDVVRLQYMYGNGVENYMNDATTDVGVATETVNGVPHIKGKTLPVQGAVAFLDHNWSPKLSTSIGWSNVTIYNSNGQAANAFRQGNYALVNLLATPVKNWMYGAELQWGERSNYKDGFTTDQFRVQFSVRANFGKLFGGKS